MENVTHYFTTGLVGGLFACAHCLGMCGGFLLALSGERPLRQLSWQVGRIATYLFLGAVAGYLGKTALSALEGRQLQELLGCLLAAAILVAAARLAGLLPATASLLPEGALTRLGRELVALRAPGAPLVLGMLTALLPCPITIAFLAYGARSGSVAAATAAMGGLGVGTLLPLTVAGGAGRVMSPRLKLWAPKAAAMLLVLLALVTAFRGSATLHRLLPALELPGEVVAASTPSCCQGEAHGR